MSLTSQVGAAAGVLAAAGAAVSLWLGAERYAGPPRRAYRWFAAAAALWGAGVITGHLLTVPVGAAAIPLSFGDLPSLLALPVMAAGFARLAAAGAQEPAAASRANPAAMAGSARSEGRSPNESGIAAAPTGMASTWLVITPAPHRAAATANQR